MCWYWQISDLITCTVQIQQWLQGKFGIMPSPCVFCRYCKKKKNRASLISPFTFLLLYIADSLMSHLWSDLRIMIHCQMSTAFFSFTSLLVSHVAYQILNQFWSVFLVGDLLSPVGNSINVVHYECIYNSFIVKSVLQQVHSLSDSRSSKECNTVLPLSNSSIFSFP